MSAGNGDGLDALRTQIDTVDEGIIDLLTQRAAVSRAIGELKRSQGDAEVYKPEREAALLARLRARAAGSALPADAVDRIYAAVLETSKQMQTDSAGATAAIAARAAPGVVSLSPYQPGMTEEELRRDRKLNRIIKLASNENPLGPSERARAAAEAAAAESHRYPDGGATELREALGRELGVDPGWITAGAGSDNLFELIARVFLGPGREAVHSQYSFAMYPINTLAAGATPVAAPAHDFGHDPDAMVAAVNERTRVVFIANPNNPTGTYLNERALRSILDRVPPEVIVVLDEAYFEYVEVADYPNGCKLLELHPNLVVTRTFSKIHGLGGLRIGYAIASPQITDLLNRVRGPFNVARASLAAAVAALSDRAFIERSRDVNRKGYAQLTSAFAEMGLEFIPSIGNFVCVRMPAGRAARGVFDALLDKGIIVRPMESYEMPEYLRVSIGTEEENTAFIDALSPLVH